MATVGFLDKRRSIASPGFNRWLIPPAAVAIHLCIGQVYALSVFVIPLSRSIGITKPVPGDWSFTQLGWIFSLAIAVLGISAALFGRWLEDAGPRKAMFAAACCFGGGFLVAAAGAAWHQLWLIYLGYGVLGGIGLGLGYISPVSTLIKWFIDRPGMATGLAIMGFGGGAMIAAPLSNLLLAHFQNAHSTGVAGTFVALGIIYFCFMMFGVFTVRIPAPGWTPANYVPRPAQANSMITSRNINVNTAFATRQFWLLWVVLCANVTAGIAVLSLASPMIQEMFNFKIRFGSAAAAATVAAGFVGLLSLFNMLGRFFWSTASDYIGRKATYSIFFILGALLYVGVTFTGARHLNSIGLFVAGAAIIISMYGGGFATVPAYLRDMFGTMHVSAIHGRLLTAWSAAGVLGPLLINYIRDTQLRHGVAPANAYSVTLYIMAGLLIVGLICNLLVTPVTDRQLADANSADAVQPNIPGRSMTPAARYPGADADRTLITNSDVEASARSSPGTDVGDAKNLPPEKSSAPGQQAPPNRI